MAKHPPAKMSAVLGRCRRTGRWRLGARSNVLAVFGSVRLDMRHSFVEGEEPAELKMKVTVLFGSAVLILPEGAEVRPSGMSLLSAEWVDVPDHPVPSGLPTLEVEWTCVLGRVHVVTGSVLEKAAQEKAEEKAGHDATGDEPVADAGWEAEPEPAAEPKPEPEPVAVAVAVAEPEPVAETVVDMGMVDSEPWSMSDFAEAEAQPQPEPDPELQPEPEPQAEVPESAAPLAEAWRSHDWGPGITERDEDDEPAPATEPGPEPAPESAAEPVAETGEAAPQLVEAWRSHDWGPGIVHGDDEDEDDDASATAGASA